MSTVENKPNASTPCQLRQEVVYKRLETFPEEYMLVLNGPGNTPVFPGYQVCFLRYEVCFFLSGN